MLISCFQDQRSHFIANTLLRFTSHKKYMRNVWNISNEKYKKLRNYGCKMKELNHFVLEKGCFIPLKGYLFLTKWHSDIPEGQV